MSKLVQFGVYDATFRPARTDDLKPEAAALVGHRGRWDAVFVIDADTRSDGAYAGQMALGLYGWDRLDGKAPAWPGWAPECDFEIHAYLGLGYQVRARDLAGGG